MPQYTDKRDTRKKKVKLPMIDKIELLMQYKLLIEGRLGRLRELVNRLLTLPFIMYYNNSVITKYSLL